MQNAARGACMVFATILVEVLQNKRICMGERTLEFRLNFGGMAYRLLHDYIIRIKRRPGRELGRFSGGKHAIWNIPAIAAWWMSSPIKMFPPTIFVTNLHLSTSVFFKLCTHNTRLHPEYTGILLFSLTL